LGNTKDTLWLNLKELPYFRALLRAVEASVYPTLNIPSPTLDLGCGDGHFASVAFDRKLDVGVDPWWGPIREASGRGCYLNLANTNGAFLPFPDGYFSSVVSNSVLEHIPPLDAVLGDVSRVMKKGAPFVFCVPNDRFLSALSIGGFFDKVGLSGLGNQYRAFFNRISRHYHCDPPVVWEARLGKAGFRINRWWHYFPPKALHVLEWGHYFGLPALVSKKLFGKWILAPYKWNLALTEKLTRPYFEAPIENDDGVYTFYIAEKI